MAVVHHKQPTEQHGMRLKGPPPPGNLQPAIPSIGYPPKPLRDYSVGEARDWMTAVAKLNPDIEFTLELDSIGLKITAKRGEALKSLRGAGMLAHWIGWEALRTCRFDVAMVDLEIMATELRR